MKIIRGWLDKPYVMANPGSSFPNCQPKLQESVSVPRAGIRVRPRSRPPLNSIAVACATFALATLQPAVTNGQEVVGRTNTESQTSGGTLEEVTVTARKREENLQDVPISIQTIDGQARIERNLNSLLTLSETLPSLHIGTGGRSDDLYIRGIGSGTNQGFDQSVGLFIDDIYHGRSRVVATTFLDLERVEVLKGPQSTYFGNNAIAGALNIVSRRPGAEFGGFARALYGEHGQFALEGAIGGPVTDNFGIRAALTYNGVDGWLENVNDGEGAPDRSNLGGRLTLTFNPVEDLDATFKIEGGSNRDHSGFLLQIDDCPPPAPFVRAGFCNVVLGLGAPTGLDNNKLAMNPGQEFRLDSTEYVLTMNYQHGGHVVTSVTGYYEYDYNLNLDADNTPVSLLHIQAPEEFDQFSQEIRIASPGGQTFDYLAGAYFQTSDLLVTQDQSYFFLTPVITSIPAFARLVPYLPLGQEVVFSQGEKAYSVFGALTWNLTDRLSVGGELRGSWVNKEYRRDLVYGTATEEYGGFVPLPANLSSLAQAFANGPGLGVATPLRGERDDDAWMPSARIQYRFDPGMVYLSYSNGFKAGGFNVADTTGVAGNVPFAAEHVDAYEAGLKSKWFGGRLVLNLSLFRSDYEDLQVAVNVLAPGGGFIGFVRNAAESRSQGAELEARWAVTDSLLLTAHTTYLDAYYVSYPDGGATALQQRNGFRVQDLSGRPTRFAPEWSGGLTATYSTLISDNVRLSAEVNAQFSSRFYIHPSIDDELAQEGYRRLDGRLSLETADRRWAIDVIGKNLTNRDILVWASGLPTALGSTMKQRQQPRNVAVQLRHRW